MHPWILSFFSIFPSKKVLLLGTEQNWFVSEILKIKERDIYWISSCDMYLLLWIIQKVDMPRQVVPEKDKKFFEILKNNS